MGKTIIMDLHFRGCEGLDLIYLAGNKVKSKDLANTVMKFQVPCDLNFQPVIRLPPADKIFSITIRPKLY